MLDGKEHYEPFFGNTPIAEVGFELENRLFGGIITRMYRDKAVNDEDTAHRYVHDGKRSALTDVLVLLVYPCHSFVEMYRVAGGSMQTRSEADMIRPLDVAWRVSLSSVAKLFADSYWQSPTTINEARLYPDRTVFS